MADAADDAQLLYEAHLTRSIAAARAPQEEGEAGECADCGYERKRLVRGRCAFCRDGRSPHPEHHQPSRSPGAYGGDTHV
jgi:hypothetical protein